MQRERVSHSVSRPARRVTISDLADQLSLTKGTVSRALNGYPDIAERTRLRVQKAANDMGYRPLSQAQAIRTGRVRSIGFVVDLHEHDAYRPFLAEFLAGVSAAAAREDWTLTVTTATAEDDITRLFSQLYDARKVDGFILPRTYEHDERAQALRAAGVPYVLFGRVADMADTAYFDISGENAMSAAVTRLHVLGHRRIGFVQGGEGYTYSRLRLEGYRSGLAASGLSYEPQLVAGPALTQSEGQAAAEALLAQANPPTAIVYAVDRAALGAYAAAQNKGLKIGADLSIISYDGIPEGAMMAPPLSSFHVDQQEAGMRLAELLIRLIRGEDASQLQELAQAEFRPGGSHGPPATP